MRAEPQICSVEGLVSEQVGISIHWQPVRIGPKNTQPKTPLRACWRRNSHEVAEICSKSSWSLHHYPAKYLADRCFPALHRPANVAVQQDTRSGVGGVA